MNYIHIDNDKKGTFEIIKKFQSRQKGNIFGRAEFLLFVMDGFLSKFLIPHSFSVKLTGKSPEIVQIFLKT